jgi:anti-sigma regulatory factor (Ser/Thr protein kinase)
MNHVNVLCHSDDELARRVVTEVTEGLEAGEAVLVCLPDRPWQRLRGRLGTAAARVSYMPAADRYARPVQAMSALSDFIERRLDAGANGIRAIGQIDFAGDATDAEWFRYEAAVNDVFASAPLRAVCLTEATLEPGTVRQLSRIHPAWDDGSGERASDHYDPAEVCRHLPPAVEAPARMPDLEVGGTAPAAIRRTVTAAVAHVLPADRIQDLLLVVTELLTNATRHGGGDAALRIWLEPAEAIVTVSDRGAGISDPYFGLRPARFGPGGRGLWLVNHLADGVASTIRDGVHTITARLPAQGPAAALA